jgi:hypothetical protein
MDRVEQSRAGDSCGISTSLEGEFIVIDTARDIRRQDQRHIDGFGRPRGACQLPNCRDSQRNDGHGSGDAHTHTTHRNLLRDDTAAKRRSGR